MGRLDGKVALICGTSPNNGGTIAHLMAKEGATIAANDIVPEVAEETARFLGSRGYQAVAVPGDASDPNEIESIVGRCVDRLGHLDTVVNLAGRQFRWPVTDVNIHDWNRQIQGFLTGGMLTTKHAARAMIEQGRRGCILHVISSAGHYGEPGNSGYSATKAGLLNFARAAAVELAHHGIRVNTITPYFMEHNLFRFGAGSRFRLRNSSTPDDFLKSIPMGRFPRATDLAYAAIFLASDEAEFITGIDIPVDGGVRAKYPPWVPGEYTGASVDEYLKHNKPQRYGEPVEE
ncbi:MAG: SDR family oxidoreductase [Chloroflexi bacterium]|nr:SDR family oxidoreductase [Chloroflexota bacterium]